MKNCWNGMYLAVAETRDGARIFCGRYPTTWELSQGSKDHNQYMIKLANNTGFAMDLRNWGASHNGNEAHLCPVRAQLDCQKWRFEHLSDDAGEEEGLVADISLKNKQIEDYKSQLARKDAELVQLTERFTSQDQELDMLRKANESLRAESIALLSAKLQSTSERLEHDLGQQKRETDILRENLASLEKRFSQMAEQNVRLYNNAT
ncbi:hypothetical protein FRC12_020214 [Ceratobasidium sp. 428]|nr:hypothetical protein FRC12_020214 [Ceratobasidium sp. 428]